MLKTLLKKQLMEVFRSYFYNQKKNQARSRGGIIGMFVLFGVLMVGVLGGSFCALGWLLCAPLVEAGMGWLYFAIFGLIAILLGTFGSVFSTFSGLYLSKDNDLLLSMPIPVGTILLSRLLNVCLISLMYVAAALVPAAVMYWIFGSFTLPTLLGGLVLLLLVSIFVTLLSCLLGWVVAKLSLKLKNKSFVTVLIALAGIGLYYFLYFKAQTLLRELIENVAVYGARIKGAAYGLYLFGRVGEGDWLAMLLVAAAVAVLALLVWLLLRRTFLRIAIATGSQKKAVYREKRTAQHSADSALLKNELRRFASSANLMLNAGLGVFLMGIAAVALLIFGRVAMDAISEQLGADTTAVVLCAAICLLTTMVDLSASSVSLEGRCLWIPQSLPVTGWQVLRAKLRSQLLLGATPTLLLALIGAILLETAVPVRLLFVLTCLLCAVLVALWGQFLNLNMPVLNWTSEMTVVKQSGSVAATMFSVWGFAIVFGALYFFVGRYVSPVLYLGAFSLLLAVADALLLRWLKTRGAAILARL